MNSDAIMRPFPKLESKKGSFWHCLGVIFFGRLNFFLFFLDAQKIVWTPKKFVGRPIFVSGRPKICLDVQKCCWTSKDGKIDKNGVLPMEVDGVTPGDGGVVPDAVVLEYIGPEVILEPQWGTER